MYILGTFLHLLGFEKKNAAAQNTIYTRSVLGVAFWPILFVFHEEKGALIPMKLCIIVPYVRDAVFKVSRNRNKSLEDKVPAAQKI